MQFLAQTIMQKRIKILRPAKRFLGSENVKKLPCLRVSSLDCVLQRPPGSSSHWIAKLARLNCHSRHLKLVPNPQAYFLVFRVGGRPPSNSSLVFTQQNLKPRPYQPPKAAPGACCCRLSSLGTLHSMRTSPALPILFPTLLPTPPTPKLPLLFSIFFSK